MDENSEVEEAYLNDDDVDHVIDDANAMQEDFQDDEDQEFFVDDSVQGFFAHKEPVFDVAIHPTHSNLVVTGGGDDQGYLWDRETGETKFQFSGHSDSVVSVGFSCQGDYVATGGMDGKIQVWNVSDGSKVVDLEGPDEINWIDWHPKGNVLVAGAQDGTIWMWMVPSGQCMNVFSSHTGPVTCGRFSHEGKKIVSVSEDSSLILWDPKSASTIYRLTNDDQRFHQNIITCFDINQDDSVIISGSVDHSAKLILLQTGNILGSLDNHSDSIETVCFSNSLPIALTGSTDHTICIWDTPTLNLRGTCSHEDSVIQCKWIDQSPLFVSCSADKTLRLWDARTSQCTRTWSGHQDTILAFDMTRDGKTIVTTSDDGNCLVFQQ